MLLLMKIVHLSSALDPRPVHSSKSIESPRQNLPLNRKWIMYLLLRNNKQSGPYSVDELKSMGLKAYDLVWLEGKSAAWRYPCEMDELSSFAPQVEEQPFDRFYKKPVTAALPIAENAPAYISAPATAVSATPPPVSILVSAPAEQAPASPAPTYAGEPSTVPGKTHHLCDHACEPEPGSHP